jgi:hypothetical protein
MVLLLSAVRIMNGLSAAVGRLQRVAQLMAGVMHEHVVERRALHGQRSHVDAGPARLPSSATVVRGPLLRGNAEDVVSAFTSATSGSAAASPSSRAERSRS